ncbi:Hypothetical protein A7982_01859 [Minicystis rosea]|nr:Hypothetical protein A7982_01859 [Minicystis rosea]
MYPGEMRLPLGAGCPSPRLALTILAIGSLPACYLDDPLVFEPDDGGTDAGDAGDATDAAPPECTNDPSCDDGNPCTTDLCDAGICEHVAVAAGTVCGEATLCKGTPTCDAQAQCVAIEVSTDDGNACTTDACDPSTGNITHTPVSGCITSITTAGAPSPRRLHTAVWTGDRMIVWGGFGTGSPAALATGGRFDPTAGTWTPTSMTGAPPPRHSHCAVWTGDRMIVWGGFGASALETTGGIYDPVADAWKLMATKDAPAGRIGTACVWTGQELVVWSGTSGGSVLFSGARYNPATDTWKALPITNMPAARYGHSGVWTGTQALVWGGNDLFDWHKDGAFYDPALDAWTGKPPTTGAPGPREAHTALWTGSRMLVWGGFDGGFFRNDGGSLDPVGAAWTAITTTGAPAERSEHTAVWTGDRMIVWGGCGTDSCATLYGDGGAWTPSASGGSWTAIAASTNVAARRSATAVWTGNVVVIWGGRTKTGETDTGAQIYP